MNRWARLGDLLVASSRISIEVARTRQAETARLAIADLVRGLAAEKRQTQAQVAAVLGLSRQAINARFTGRVPWLAHELYFLARHWGVGVEQFFPKPKRLDLAVAS